MSGFRTSIGGTAVVCCVHDRPKREVTDPDVVRHLGLVAGVVYNPRAHKLQTCACCQNLFVAADDTPRLCSVCTEAPTHKLEAPIPDPIEGAI
jgi:hypothetical protein